MYIRITISFLLVIGLLTSCGTEMNNSSGRNSQDIQLTKISTKGNIHDQTAANRAKEILSKNDSVTAVQAVNTSNKMLITIEIPHHERFLLEKKRKELQKKMEKEFPDYKVELSTDKKIILELEDLEKKLREDNISNKKLEKELKHIIKLSKDQA
ncbi:YhcN/YlaJ family sporulation lipoprotein [Ornithinibacillus halophilus]|uniref:YhcN/YlaJ family sporulation lipoprotein n=1 Tax=Ornithinibacillus halophilus TaxID=930117 RepID=UPI0013565236|nr:YhcN/YlaJ family sporulation lipoprotein [Ornithinibacillus halophilus]